MKKSILLVIFVMLIAAVMVQAGQRPKITIDNVEHQNKTGGIIAKAYYSGDKIIVDSTLSDEQNWWDIKEVYLSMGENTLDCYRNSIINLTDVTYKCVLIINDLITGDVVLYLNATDKEGLKRGKKIGNYYFNSPTNLSYGNLSINGTLDAGKTSTSDWITFNITTYTNNPYKVYISGKNLYPETSDCGYETYCRYYRKNCSFQITGYRNVTRRVCEQKTVNLTRIGRVCTWENGINTCELVETIVPRTGMQCSYEAQQDPIKQRVCVDTTDCLSYSRRSTCGINSGQCPTQNVLDLANFEYKVKGAGVWLTVPLLGNKALIYDKQGNKSFELKLRINVPNPCSGNYVADGRNIFLELVEET